jgi:histidinol-phosphate aminotransferase
MSRPRDLAVAPAPQQPPPAAPPAIPDTWKPAAHAWQLPRRAATPHGGTDAQGPPCHDFSSNTNAAGPLPTVARCVDGALRTRYPDPHYHALRRHLAAWHGVAPARVVVAGSASEFIHRFTVLAARWGGVRHAVVPQPGYGDYAAAAMGAGLDVRSQPAAGRHALWWITEPGTPTGRPGGTGLGEAITRAHAAGACIVLDLAYQPLRRDAGAALAEAAWAAAPAWQLWSPNKACGLPGVRGAYAIAPAGAEDVAEALAVHAPSWVLGADGAAMLGAFATPAAQAELAGQREQLHGWRDTLASLLRAAGWQVLEADSVTPFFVARPPQPLDLDALRAAGIKLRDTASMGLPGWLRLSAQPPPAIEALRQALQAAPPRRTGAPADTGAPLPVGPGAIGSPSRPGDRA